MEVSLNTNTFKVLKAISVVPNLTEEEKAAGIKRLSSYTEGVTKAIIANRMKKLNLSTSTINRSIKVLCENELIAEGLKITDCGAGRKRGYSKSYYITDKGIDFLNNL
ncbi:winged helix-turn-helix domain-containing protein [Clostridium thermobutyricum]|uniref:winged helix-turn-helix domain-containing protein n=1 Tax=Clostridium thermobutyricum TaxID=29372 RepID=UPI0018A90D04|nr:YjcQ family protein [Clostridium thermobutyricum]